jgi:hypothetical protein
MAEAAPQKAAVLFIMPEWGRGKGGVYASARSLIYHLRQEKRRVDCTLGMTSDELSSEDRLELRELEVNLYGPDIELDRETEPPAERMLNYSEYYSSVHVRPPLRDYSHMVVFTNEAAQVAEYFLGMEEMTACKMIRILAEKHDGRCTFSEEDLDVTESVRLSSATFTLGTSLYRRVNDQLRSLERGLIDKHYSLIPNLSNAFEHGKIASENDDASLLLFVPHSHSGGEWRKEWQCTLEGLLCCLDEIHNDYLLSAVLEHKPKVLVQSLCKAENQEHIRKCSTKPHEHVHAELLTSGLSRQKMNQLLHSRVIVVASGHMDEEGFSGLEYLLNGIPTMVPEGTDVAELMMKTSPIKSKNFILKSVFGKGQKDAEKIIHDGWRHQIVDLLKSYSDTEKVTAEILASLHNSQLFTEGNEQLSECLSSKL